MCCRYTNYHIICIFCIKLNFLLPEKEKNHYGINNLVSEDPSLHRTQKVGGNRSLFLSTTTHL